MQNVFLMLRANANKSSVDSYENYLKVKEAEYLANEKSWKEGDSSDLASEISKDFTSKNEEENTSK